MPDDITKNLDNFIDFIKKHWFGELYEFPLILIAINFFCLELGKYFSLHLTLVTFGIIILVNLTFIYFWLSSRYCYPKGQKNKITIIFGLHEEEGKIKKDVEEKFIEIMDIYDFLSKKVKIRILNKYKSEKIDKRTLAEKLSGNKKWHLLVWGKVKKYTDQYVFDIKFTNTYRDDPTKKNSQFIRERGSEVIDNKSWRISPPIKFDEINKIAENLREVSLYIIGCSCLTTSNYETALNIFYILYNLIKPDKLRIKNDPNTKRVFKRIPSFISDCYHSIAMNCYLKQKDVASALILIDEAVAWELNDRLLLNKAYLRYLIDVNNVEESLKTISDSNDKRFFFAFVSMMKNDKIEFAYNLYKKCFTKKYTQYGINTEIFYINDYYARHKDKIQCLFIIGMIYKEKTHNNYAANKYFKKFLKLSNNQEHLGFLIEQLNVY